MQEELRYFASFPKALKRFRGKHIALIKNKVIASGNEAIGVFEQAKKLYPKKRIVLAYVPKEETLVLIFGERI
ncbi:MAG: DUF5678 domain-containing protein [Candidatus Thermoplasmatota archaeon]